MRWEILFYCSKTCQRIELDRLSEDSIIARPLPRTTKVNRFDSTPTNGKMLKMKKKTWSKERKWIKEPETWSNGYKKQHWHRGYNLTVMANGFNDNVDQKLLSIHSIHSIHSILWFFILSGRNSQLNRCGKMGKWNGPTTVHQNILWLPKSYRTTRKYS